MCVLRFALQSSKPEVTIVPRKPNWDKCDKQMYRQSIANQLKSFDSVYIRNSSELDILYPLGHFNAVLKVATMESIPNYKQETRLKQLKFRPWTEKIYTAAKQSKLKWWEWKKAGASRDSIDANYTRMREAKRCLRREQRREAARRRGQKIESIMTAENDSKTFFRLVKQQRKTPGSQTDSLVVDGKRCDTREEVCQGWSTQKLALPLENERFDSEYKKLVDMDIDNITAICETESRQISPVSEKEVRTALNRLKNNKAADSMGLCS